MSLYVSPCLSDILGYIKPENAIANHVDEEDKTTTLIQGTGSNYKSNTVILLLQAVGAAEYKRREGFLWLNFLILSVKRSQCYIYNPKEREILHNYLEELGKHYESIEPVEAADSMCKIYNSLAITNKFRCILGTAEYLLYGYLFKLSMCTKNLHRILNIKFFDHYFNFITTKNTNFHFIVEYMFTSM